MISPETLSLVRSSWKLAKRDTRGLTKAFYTSLFEVAPGVRGLFPEDLREQRRKLGGMLDALVTRLDDLPTVILELSRLAERHVTYGAEPPHYPVVGQTLVGALKSQLGDDFTPEVEAAWVELYGLISSVMLEVHRSEPLAATC